MFKILEFFLTYTVLIFQKIGSQNSFLKWIKWRKKNFKYIRKKIYSNADFLRVSTTEFNWNTSISDNKDLKTYEHALKKEFYELDKSFKYNQKNNS